MACICLWGVMRVQFGSRLTLILADSLQATQIVTKAVLEMSGLE